MPPIGWHQYHPQIFVSTSSKWVPKQDWVAMGCGNVTLSHPCFKAKTFDAINHAKLVMVQTRQRTCPSRVPACQPKNRYIQFCQTFGKTIKDNEPTVDTSYWCKPDLIYTLFLVQHPCQCGNNRIVQYLLRSPPPV